MKLSYINKSDDITLVASSADNDYPITNVQHQHLSKKWKSLGTEENIVCDYIDNVNIESIYLAGLNLSDTAIVKIQANDTDDWTTPLFDQDFLIEDNIYYYFNNDNTEYRYWRVYIKDDDNSDGYITMGRLWMGDILKISGPHISFVETRNNTSATTISISGQSYGDVGYIYRTWEMSYPYINNTEKKNIETFSDTVNKAQPFFATFADDNGCQLGPVYVILTNDTEFTHLKTLDIWSNTLSFMEVK